MYNVYLNSDVSYPTEVILHNSAMYSIYINYIKTNILRGEQYDIFKMLFTLKLLL